MKYSRKCTRAKPDLRHSPPPTREFAKQSCAPDNYTAIAVRA